MQARKLLIYGGGAVAAALGWYYLVGRYDEPGGVLGDVTQALAVLTGITRGKRLTRAPYDTTTGVVPDDPQALADAAGVDLDTYALARAIASEEGDSSNTIKAAVAWAMMNHAAGHSIASILLHANNPDHSGHFGTYKDIDPGTDDAPNDHKGQPDRYASTALDPYAGDLEIAQQVISGQLPDITHGADLFDRPAHEDADYVAKKRTKAGYVLADVDGIDPDVDGIRFWVHA